MKPTALSIERWLNNVEARFVPPPRKCLRVIVHTAVDKEKAFAELAARGRTVEDIHWSDDMAAAQAKALAEHVAAHPEDAGRTVADFDWTAVEIVHSLTEDERIAEDIAEDTDKDAAVSETVEPIDLPPPAPGCLARSKPWRPVHQRPSIDHETYGSQH